MFHMMKHEPVMFGAVRSRQSCERLLKRTGSSAPDDVGTPRAELSRNQIMAYVVVPQ